MTKHLEKAMELRACTSRHYNCAQSVLIAFSDVTGLDEEQAMKVAASFGAGMKRGEVCGAISGGLMVLGFLGLDDPATILELFEKIKNENGNCYTCKDLNRYGQSQGILRKPHCDSLVYSVVEFIDSKL